MKRVLAVALIAAALAGLAVAWSPGRWAVAVSQVSILAVAIVWAVGLVSGRVSPPSAASWPVAGLVLLGAAQLVMGWTIYRWSTGETTLYWFTNFTAFAVASSLAADRERRDFLRRCVFISGAALAFVSVLQEYTAGGRAFWLFETPYPDSVYGPFLYKNQFAAFVELLLPIAWTGALVTRQRRWVLVVITGALYACVVASISRAGLVAATAELLIIPAILLVTGSASAGRVGRTCAPLVVVAALLAWVVGPETLWTRLQEEQVYATRRDMTVASIAMFRDKPLQGYGLGTWPSVYPHYAHEDDGLFANQAHNDWAQAAAEGGIPALLCYAALFLCVAYAGWRRPWSLGLAVVLLHASVDYPIQRQAIGVWYFLLAGLALGRGDRLWPYSRCNTVPNAVDPVAGAVLSGVPACPQSVRTRQ